MAQPTPLDFLKESATALVAQGLRSDSVVIARLATLIEDTVQAGVSHHSVHRAITGAGLAISWTNYRIALGRARKAQRDGRSLSSRSPASLSIVATAPECEAATPVTPEQSGEKRTLGSTSSATRVMDALRQAREVANSKDYGQIARDLYRQQQRDQRRKERP